LGKELKVMNVVLFMMLSLHLSAGTEKFRENISPNSRYPGRVSIRAPPEYKSSSVEKVEYIPFKIVA
jgi:hypothetical protein